ncbi:hypothetical protein [Psychrobacter jeotgali]|uniref:hypothetical protein n=1 Tax=Psychrobacter jeotgali TaxID=179010 RepID=UPI00191A7C8B|nr:hypothetical protein [Psychrobacter jeotgali]
MITIPVLTLSAPSLKLQQKALAMYWSVPQVMASRIWRIATTPMDSKAQQKEIHSMIAEKQTAFIQSIGDINSQIIASQITLAHEWMSDWQRLMLGNYKAFNNFGIQLDQEANKVMDKGINPYAKTVKANKDRLSN